MLIMPPFECISWSDIFLTSCKIAVQFVTFMNWFELVETLKVVKDVGRACLMVR